MRAEPIQQYDPFFIQFGCNNCLQYLLNIVVFRFAKELKALLRQRLVRLAQCPHCADVTFLLVLR